MLQFIKKLFFKNRKDHRHLVHNGSFVVVVPTNDGTETKWTVNVIDISLGGAAFIYEGSPDDLAKSGLISFSNDVSETVDVSKTVGFETVSDIECSEESTHRRRGVKFEWKSGGYCRHGDEFEWMGVLGEKQLVEFIKEHGLPAGRVNK
ncbi:MAG: PilZ domain-containing protein [Syntrophus sp. (in: bacteria)]